MFEGKLSVSPYFLHHHQHNNGVGMLLIDKLSLKTLGVYIFIRVGQYAFLSQIVM